ncbi:MotE family protein [Brevundimonas aurifodinae]|uniref:Magnesium transporter MgtE intracellular domain-containing protein n=1 Tax=Brevundimonas aurifodinae TaxID=1508312 RepID=A0ABV1NLL1_9CAUL
MKLPRLLPLIAVAIGGVVAVRAVGAGPDLFQGAVAWAEEAAETAGEAVTPAAAARTVPAVCALSPEQLAQQAGISPAELRIIQSLSARRTELDARDADFATTLPLMVAAEQKLDAKITALNAIKAEVQTLLGQVDEREAAETARLVSVYSAMRPREAAAVFATLADDVRLPIAAAMRPRSLSAIMAQMPPAAARELTEKLAGRFQAQQLAARAAAAAAIETAATPGPAQTPAAAPAATPPATQTAASAAAAPAAQRAASRATPPPTQRAANRPTPRQPARTPASDTTGTTPPAPPGPQAYQPTAGAPAAGAAAPRQSVQ